LLISKIDLFEHICVFVLSDNLKKYVRSKLGPCDNCKYNTIQQKLRFDFDARSDECDTKKNINIVENFNEFYGNKKVIIYSGKGGIYAYIININDYNKYKNKYLGGYIFIIISWNYHI
jgi:hypothetical protein